MSVNLYSDQSRQVNWTVREDTDATMTVTCTTSGSATNLTSYTFIAEFYKVGGTTHFLQLTQGAGITNNGATGIFTIALTDTQLNLTPGEYWWRLRTTAPTDNYWFNGIFKVNGYVWDGSTNSEVAVALTIGQTAIDLSITIAGSSSGSGTVTSFSAGDLTPLFTTSEANPTTTPALSFTQITKAANLVFAGPTTGSAANPDFRALVAADIPNLASVYDAAGLAAAAQAASQPLDSDLTAIAALTTTAYGRTLLTLANAAALRSTAEVCYTLAMSMGLSTNPADGTTYYNGFSMRTWPAGSGESPIVIKKAGTLTVGQFHWNTTAVSGSNENISLYIRVNNTTDYLVATVGSTAANKVFSNIGLSISLAVDDYIEIKLVCPTWATNPTGATLTGTVYINY